MNHYPSWWNQTLTVYNKYIDPQTKVITWHRHVITNCFWKDVGNKITVGNTILETKDIICRIPIREDFMEKYLWYQLPNDEMDDYFTLGENDIIIKEEVVDEIDEYTKGHRSTDILAKYKALQGCMVINKVGLNIGGGRGNEHYHVRGT